MGTKIEDPTAFLDSVRAFEREPDWVEFKQNNFENDTVGQYVSALANSAIIHEKDEAYLIFGIENGTHDVVGTNVNVAAKTVGSEPFMLWLSKYLEPHIYVHHQRVDYQGKPVEVLCIKPPYQQPVRFKGRAYVRVAGSQQVLNNHPALERTIWAVTSRYAFEATVVEPNVPWRHIDENYGYRTLLKRLNKRYDTPEGAADILASLDLLKPNLQRNFDVVALLGLACARDMNRISLLADKTVRVIVYKGTDKLDAITDREGTRGYTNTFDSLMEYVMDKIPHSEVMKHGIRTTEYRIPEATVREFLANAIIHQDFTQLGARPVIEIYSDKVRIVNPGTPLVEPDRFIDAPSKSRNPGFAKLMRAAGLCEQRGSGVDRALREVERASLPPPLIQAVEGSTMVTIYMSRPFTKLTADDRVRACYQHACLMLEAGDFMSNGSLRKRFGLGEKQYPQVSEVISNAIDAGRIRPLNEGQANRIARYVPYWA
jgi:predicted HTH transcriptional regulator